MGKQQTPRIIDAAANWFQQPIRPVFQPATADSIFHTTDAEHPKRTEDPDTVQHPGLQLPAIVLAAADAAAPATTTTAPATTEGNGSDRCATQRTLGNRRGPGHLWKRGKYAYSCSAHGSWNICQLGWCRLEQIERKCHWQQPLLELPVHRYASTKSLDSCTNRSSERLWRQSLR